jgi:hypothetical protein
METDTGLIITSFPCLVPSRQRFLTFDRYPLNKVLVIRKAGPSSMLMSREELPYYGTVGSTNSFKFVFFF